MKHLIFCLGLSAAFEPNIRANVIEDGESDLIVAAYGNLIDESYSAFPTPFSLEDVRSMCRAVVEHKTCAAVPEPKRHHCDLLGERDSGQLAGLGEGLRDSLTGSLDMLKVLGQQIFQVSTEEKVARVRQSLGALRDFWLGRYRSSADDPTINYPAAHTAGGLAVSAYEAAEQMLVRGWNCYNPKARASLAGALLGEVAFEGAAMLPLSVGGLGRLFLFGRLGNLKKLGEVEKLERMRELRQLKNLGPAEQLELRNLELEDVDLGLVITHLGPEARRVEADALNKARAAKYDEIMKRPSAGEDFVPVIPALPALTTEQALQNAKASFYEMMISRKHWKDTGEMTLARQEYNNYRGNLLRRKRELREAVGKAEENIYKGQQRILSENLDGQQKAFLEASIANQRKERKQALDALRKIDKESPGKAQAFIRLQEQRYDELIQSQPAKDLRRGQPLHEFGEKIKKLEEKIAREASDGRS